MSAGRPVSASLRQVPPEIRNMSQELLAVRYWQMLSGKDEGGALAKRAAFRQGVIYGVYWGLGIAFAALVIVVVVFGGDLP